MAAPLRTAFVLLALFEMVYLLEVWLFELQYAATAKYFIGFDVGLATAAFDCNLSGVVQATLARSDDGFVSGGDCSAAR